jgi:3-hydroxybutyryl-CoA dehydrogenase
MTYAIIQNGDSRSFPEGDAFLVAAGAIGDADVLVLLGRPKLLPDAAKAAVLVELGSECLGFHTGEDSDEPSNVVGFARYRNGNDAPSPLVELVRQPNTSAEALAAARALFERAGLAVVVSADQAGRIIDRLVRPKYNAALKLLDEGLGSQKDIDLTCRLGLGYADGPIERAVRGGLAEHHDISAALFKVYATPAYAPARKALVAAQRRDEALERLGKVICGPSH